MMNHEPSRRAAATALVFALSLAGVFPLSDALAQEAAPPAATAPAATTETPAAAPAAAPEATPAATESTGGPAPGRPASPAIKPVESSRELLELFGVEASYYDLLADDQEVDVAENEALLRTLLAINRFSTLQIFQWTKPASLIREMLTDPEPHRGEIVAIRGRATKITKLEPLPEVKQIFGIPEFFRVELEATEPSAGFATAVVYTLKIPNAWRAAPTPPFGEYRTSLTGFFFKRAGAGRPVFTATRMAWHPPGFLGDLGMDLSRYDEVQQHTRVLPRDPFYELLAAMGRASKDHIKRLTAGDLKSPTFDRAHVRDWFVFPWRLRAAAEVGRPSPAKRLFDLMPPDVQTALRSARPDSMPPPETVAGLLAGLNANLANPALFDPGSFAELFLDQSLLNPVELALLRHDRKVGVQFQKQKLAYIDAVKRDVAARRKEKPPTPRPPEYDALIRQGLGLLSAEELVRWNRTLLETAFPNEIGATQPLSVVPLFLTPETQEGRLVRLEGVCRRALKVQVSDPEIVARLGVKEYFEMWLFTEDSQEFPIVCIVHRLPRGIPEGDDITEMVRVRGVFLKTWTFESARTLRRKAQLAQQSLQQQKGARPQAVELVGGQPPSPVIIGLDAEWMRSARVASSLSEAIRAIVLGAVLLFVVGVWTALQWNGRADRELERKMLLHRYGTAEGVALGSTNWEVIPEPDFRNYGREPDEPVPPAASAIEAERGPEGLRDAGDASRDSTTDDRPPA